MNRILPKNHLRFHNCRLLLCLAVVATLVRTANANDTFTIYGNAMIASYPGPMLGGSVHYEHRVTPADGLTLRAQGGVGPKLADEGATFVAAMVLVGYSRHYGAGYLNIEAGYLAVRTGRYSPEFDLIIPAEWDHVVDGQVAFGRRIGPIDIGLWNNVPISKHPGIGVGVYLGFAID